MRNRRTVTEGGPGRLAAGVTAAIGLWLAAATTLPAQAPVSDREMLESRIAQLEGRLTVSENGKTEELRRELDWLRRRLAEGDFRTGDAIALIVRGEEALTDTFRVEPPRQLRLPGIDPIDLTGILRDEAERYLSDELARFLREPEVRVTPLVRVGVLGAVESPGYYLLPPTAPMIDVFGAAGGVDNHAKLDDLELRRSGKKVASSEALRDAMAMGSTLRELDVQPGDEFYVPQGEGPISTREWVWIVSGVVGLTLTVLRAAGAI